MSSISPIDPSHPVEDDVRSQDDTGLSWVDRPVPPLIQRGQEAFRRDLPRLLEKHAGQWVAYSGDRQLGIARSKRELYQRCLRQGLGDEEFVVRGIEPEMVEGSEWEAFVAAVEALNPVEEDLGLDEDGASSWVDRPVPPLIQGGQEAFRRDLPDLLQKHAGQWVAYSGDRRIALGRSKIGLFQLCERQGLGSDEFVVRGIEPEMPDELDWEEFRDI